MVRNPPVPSTKERVWRRLTGLSLLIAAGWTAALLYHYVMGGILRLPYPANTFLFDPGDRFADLTNTWGQAKAAQPYQAGGPAASAYFPVVYAGLKLLSRASRPWAVAVYLLAAIGATAAMAAAWIRRERPRFAGDPRWAIIPALILFVTLANYPFLFAIDRGNVDPIITALLAAAVLTLQAGRPLAGGALLGLSAAAKGFPIVAAALWLRRRGGAAGAAVAVAVLAALVVLPGLLFAGGIPATLRGLAAGLSRFRALYVFGEWSAHYSADGLNALRIGMEALGFKPDLPVLVASWEAVALVWAALLGLAALLLAGALWRQGLAVALVMLVFPNVTNDYKLVVLVPVVLAWLSSDETSPWRDRTFALCAGLLFVPKHYGPVLAGQDATVSCLVSPLLLAGLTATLWPTAAERADARERLARWRGLFGPGGASKEPGAW